MSRGMGAWRKMSEADLARLGTRGPKAPAPAPKAARGPEMNKTETAYAQLLELRRSAGEIAWWGFEAAKLRLGKPGARAYYTPDFAIVGIGGETEFHEVKGRKGKRYYSREDAKLKVKIAAATYPMYRFRIVWETGGGGWGEEGF